MKGQLVFTSSTHRQKLEDHKKISTAMAFVQGYKFPVFIGSLKDYCPDALLKTGGPNRFV